MKNIITASVLFLSSLCGSFAEYNYSLLAGYIYDEEGSQILDASFALVACLDSVDISDITLEENDVLTAGDWFNSDSSSGMYVFNVSSTTDGFLYVDPNSNFLDNDVLADKGFSGSENVVLIAWDTTGDTMSADTKYFVFSPELVGGELSGGAKWTLNSSNSGIVNWAAYTTEFDESGKISWDNMAFINSVVPVPEPAEYAAAFGVLALVLAYIRKRK